MPVDPTLLDAAVAARRRMAELEADLDHGKVDYQHAVRRLYHSGASLREIAKALGVSHQRVHQLVDSPDGEEVPAPSEGRRRGRRRACDLACSFCGMAQPPAAKIIAGPGVYICDRCVRSANRVALRGGTETHLGVRLSVERRADVACNFCGKDTGQVVAAVTAKARDRRICAECLALCNDIIAEHAVRP